jgi:hypothetical protein
MSDFDAVLERLLGDPSFAAALRADPSAALAGYRLSGEEIELLSAQMSVDAGGQHAVESRTSQASMFGLLAPLAGAAGLTGMTPGARTGLGAAELAEMGVRPPQAGFGAAEAVQAGFGQAPEAAHAGFGQAPVDAGFGQPQGTAHAGFGQAPERSGLGPAEAAGGSGSSGGPGGSGGTGSTGGGSGSIGGAFGGDVGSRVGQQLDPPADYRTRVDVNGDGRWDRHWYVGREDGGVDIMADMNRDGRVDFVGHDFDRDGLIDAADYDKNRDGRLETHMFDDDGDGWMDRKIVSPER